MKMIGFERWTGAQQESLRRRLLQIPEKCACDGFVLRVTPCRDNAVLRLRLDMVIANRMKTAVGLIGANLQLRAESGRFRMRFPVTFSPALHLAPESFTLIEIPCRVDLTADAAGQVLGPEEALKCDICGLLRPPAPQVHCLPFILQTFAKQAAVRPDVLVLGDSVMGIVSRYDQDKKPLAAMIQSGLYGRGISAACLFAPGFHPGVYYLAAKVLQCQKHRPGSVILPINMRSFSPQWDLNPLNQKTEEIAAMRDFLIHSGHDPGNLLGIDHSVGVEEFHRTEVLYPDSPLRRIGQFEETVVQKPATPAEKAERYRQIFTYHYLHPLAETHRKWQLLHRSIAAFLEAGIGVAAYLTPINVEAGRRYVGIRFDELLRLNTEKLSAAIRAGYDDAFCFADFSFLFGAAEFAHENDSAEHLNEKGRTALKDRLLVLLEHLRAKQEQRHFYDAAG